MSDTVIRVENLGKKYIISHQQQGRSRYTALRDVLADSAKSVGRRILNPFAQQPSSPTREEFWALKDVSFEIKQGDRVGIIGRNGAGKSTLLKLLSRITEPTTGRISVKGRVASLLEVGTGFHPELTGRENIFLNGAMLGMSKSEINRNFDEIVEFAEVSQFLDTPIKRYSSGMYVRLAFSVAAHLEPEILLVDEVLAVGDAAFQKKCLGRIEEVSNEGRTVLFVSHNMALISSLCERGLLLARGTVNKDSRNIDEIVQGYISQIQSNRPNSGLEQRKDRKGDGSIKAAQIRFGTPSLPHQGCWITGEEANIEIVYKCSTEKIYKNIEVALGLRKLDGTPMLYIGTKVVHQDIESISKLGRFTCKIPRLPLEPGSYLLSTEIKQNGVIVDLVESAAVIDVEDGDYYGTGVIWKYGGFLCDYSWSHIPFDTDSYS